MQATKHEGAGNDFLVVLDPDDAIRFSVAQVRLLADRRRGIGADGIIRVGPGRDGADLSMQLHNADGGEAEMSGNGIRCLAQAAVDEEVGAGDAGGLRRGQVGDEPGDLVRLSEPPRGHAHDRGHLSEELLMPGVRRGRELRAQTAGRLPDRGAHRNADPGRRTGHRLRPSR